MSSVEPKVINTVEDLPENCLVNEVAQFFRITDYSVRRWIREGEFPNTFKAGKIFLIPKQDVLDCAHRKYGKR